MVGQIKLALAENAFNLLRVDDLLFTRLDHPARMHLADLNVNVNQSSLTSIKLLSPQITDSTFAAIGVRSFTKACMTLLGALVRGGVEGCGWHVGDGLALVP